MRYISIMLAGIFLLSCETEDPVSPDVIKYGTSFGFCTGYCYTELTITDQNATLVRSSRESDTPDQLFKRNFTAEEYLKIISGFNRSKFMNLPAVIGCPDCADGGAEFIEVHSEGNIHSVVFEFGADLDGFEGLLGELRDLHDSMLPD